MQYQISIIACQVLRAKFSSGDLQRGQVSCGNGNRRRREESPCQRHAATVKLSAAHTVLRKYENGMTQEHVHNGCLVLMFVDA